MNVRAYAQRRARRPRGRIDWLFITGWRERERLYIDNVLRPHAERVSAEITLQLRRDLTLRGEAFVKVGWDLDREAATYERVSPSAFRPTLPQAALVGGLGTAVFDVVPGAREMYKRLQQAEYDALIDGILGDVSIDE